MSVLAFAACSDDESTGSGGGAGIAFKAEAEPLSGFAFDTGLIPKASPAQVSLKLSAGGKVRVEATGEATKEGVRGRAGSGKLALDVHVKLDGRLKITSALKNVDEDLPGLKDIDVPIVGESTFDPFLLEDGQSAKVDVAIPETKLPDIPLGSVPGKLQLTVTNASTLTSTFEGGCMTVASGQATYTGAAKTTGSLVLRGTLVVDLPAPLNKSVELGEITVPVPAIGAPLDFGTQPASGAGDGAVGRTCAAPPGDGTPGADGGKTGSSDGGKTGGETEDSGGPPLNFEITVDGKTTTNLSYSTRDDTVDGKLRRSACFQFKGPSGIGPQANFCAYAFAPGGGCATNGVGVQYQPDDGSFDTFFDSGDATCGFTATSASATRFAGSFAGTLKQQINGKTHQVTATFDVTPNPL